MCGMPCQRLSPGVCREAPARHRAAPSAAETRRGNSRSRLPANLVGGRHHRASSRTLAAAARNDGVATAAAVVCGCGDRCVRRMQTGCPTRPRKRIGVEELSPHRGSRTGAIPEPAPQHTPVSPDARACADTAQQGLGHNAGAPLRLSDFSEAASIEVASRFADIDPMMLASNR